MKWNMLPTDELLRKLEPPKGRIRMVLDTDTYNEVDDQFAMAYSLLSPDRMEVEAIYAAPFHNDRSNGPEDGMLKSYDEIIRLLGKMNLSADGFVFEGSRCYLPDGETYVDSPAARDLVKKAMAHSEDDPLYVVAIGAITNVASAILMEPEICKHIVIVWLGGHPLSYPTAHEFNLMQDVPAVRVVLDCGAPVVLVPCYGVASHLLSSTADMQAHLAGQNALCDALSELFCAYADDPFGWAKEIWDVSTIAWLVNPDWVPSTLEHSPMLTDDCHWAFSGDRHFIRVANYCRRTPIFRDMYAKLRTAP
ncbi:MAG: nucleoside hydrolase [Clostridia bacterium]|nr:nucleoside hydrolase [Clostridia bacterium]